MNMDMQSLIEEMNALILKIKSGTASQGEIEAFAAAAAELHERAVVLRYKSYEAKVFGTPIEPVVEVVIAEPVAEVEIVEPIVEEEPALNPTIVTHEEVVVDEPEELSFDLFDETDESSFDLFSTDVEEPKVETAIEVVNDEIEDTLIESEEPAIETVVELTIEEAIVTPQTQETAQTSQTHQTAETHQTDETQETHQTEKTQETSQTQETDITQETHQTEKTPTGDVHPLYKRLVADDNSLAARLMAVRLETLKGAFGFNERLQIIQELFKGSGEDFTKAIETLDTLGSKNEARSIVSRYAHQFEWDKDSNLALEFVQKVERRYA